MNSSLHQHSSRTALVLGGGGSTGNAWLIGVLAGLSDSGLDVTNADLTIGTSAGSTAAAQCAGANPAGLYATTVIAPPRHPNAAGQSTSVSDHLDRMNRIIAASTDAADLRRRIGAAAAEFEDRTDQWRSIVATRLPSHRWPERRRVVITAIDAGTGDPVVFDRDSGVELVDAVAASCSSSFAYRIGDRRYLDGGFRSNAENADLAAGYERVLILAPFGGQSLVPAEWGTHLSTQIDELRAGGSTVMTIVPGSDAEHLFGVNAMDFSLRPEAARAGYAQGKARADELEGFWA